MFEILLPLSLIILFVPRKIEPTPIAVVKNINISPIKKEENQTCCVANDLPSLFENVNMEKLGDITIPETAKAKVKIIELVHIPPYDDPLSNTCTIFTVPGTAK